MADAERRAVDSARRWLRFIWLQGHHIDLDGIEHDGIYESMRDLDAIAAQERPVLDYTGV